MALFEAVWGKFDWFVFTIKRLSFEIFPVITTALLKSLFISFIVKIILRFLNSLFVENLVYDFNENIKFLK